MRRQAFNWFTGGAALAGLGALGVAARFLGLFGDADLSFPALLLLAAWLGLTITSFVKYRLGAVWILATGIPALIVVGLSTALFIGCAQGDCL